MDKILVVGFGGFIGAVSRYLLTMWVQRMHGGSFSLGTLVVNVAGCLAIGACMAMVEDRQSISENVRLFLIMGLLGSFTTFSTFGYEVVGFLRDGQFRWAMLVLSGNLLLGLGAVVLGRFSAKAVGI